MANGKIEGKVSPEAFQALLLDEISSGIRELKKAVDSLLVVNKMALGFKPQVFRKPYQYKTIKAGGSDVIYEYRIPDGYVGIITQLANNWFSDTYLLWYIDNRSVEAGSRIEREISPINEPLKVNYYAKNRILFEGYNKSGSDHVFEVFCNGFLVEEKIYNVLRI